MKQVIKFLLLIAFYACLFSGCHGVKQDNSPPDRRKVIAFFGSSVCRGSGDELQLGYAGRFAQRLDTTKWKCVNLSIGGDNTIKITPRLDTCLRPQNPDYVVIGLSLSNEGIKTPKTDEGRKRIMERFRTGVLRLADSICSIGAVPVIANCYARNSFEEVHYQLICQMNAIINEWPFPSINLMGTVNDGKGGWVPGLEYNDGHPNGRGYEEMSRAIVPTLFDALEAGKKTPKRNWTSDYIQFFDMQPQKSVLLIEPDTLIHSFAGSVMFRVAGEGMIGSVKHCGGISVLSVKDGCVVYSSPEGSASVAIPTEGFEKWNYLTLSHNYAKQETNIYVNGKSSAPVKEQIKPENFALGGVAGNSAGVPDSLALKDWMIHRSSLTPHEVKDYMSWKMLQSSLEVYAPLCDTDSFDFENRAQSLTEVKSDKTAKYKIVKTGFQRDL